MLVSNIREYFVGQLQSENFFIDRSETKTLELIGASFVADEESIFGEVNYDYVRKELDWYNSQSTNVNDLCQPVPKAWQMTANKHGEINSNYGHLIYSDKYGDQFNRVLSELILQGASTRRAQMVYNRPTIWYDAFENGKNDFICTNAVTYYIRDNSIHCVVQMRSNDAWAGYRNDYAWQDYVLNKLVKNVNCHCKTSYSVGNIFWQVMNLHVYERNFYLVDHYSKTGEYHISKEKYRTLYPNSPYC